MSSPSVVVIADCVVVVVAGAFVSVVDTAVGSVDAVFSGSFVVFESKSKRLSNEIIKSTHDFRQAIAIVSLQVTSQ